MFRRIVFHVLRVTRRAVQLTTFTIEYDLSKYAYNKIRADAGPAAAPRIRISSDLFRYIESMID